MAVIKLAPESACRSETQERPAAGDVKVLLSCRKDNESEVITGPDAGMSLSEYIRSRGWGCLGKDARKMDQFPLVIRVLSNTNPSVIQVNPDTEKDTFWYILDAANDATLGFGMAQEISMDQLTAAIQNGTLGQYLNPVTVQTGDFFEVPAGTVYAMGENIRVLEIQKTGSDTRFTTDEILRSIRLTPQKIIHPHGEWLIDGQAKTIHLDRNSVFDVDLTELNGRVDLDASEDSFYALIFTEGSAVIEKGEEILHAEPENCFFVEAGTEPFHVTGNCRFIMVSLV